MKRTIVSALTATLLCTAPAPAQIQDFERYRDFFSRATWETASYGLQDHAGYEFYGYLDVPYGGYTSWDYEPEPATARLRKHPELTLDRLYMARTGGVFRGEWMTPDDIGQLFRDNGLFMGNMGSSGVETVWITKKYGLRHMGRIPGRIDQLGFSGFEEEDYARYRDSIRVLMEGHERELRAAEEAYGISLIDDPETKWLLTGSGIMHVFLDSLENNYDRVNRTFRAEAGFDIPVNPAPATPVQKARHSIFLQWARTKMAGLMALQMEIFRDVIDPAGEVISNIHGEDVIDFETHGAIVDHPGPGARAQFSNREMVLRYWNGYIFRLWRDLTDKTLFASARINNGVVRARRIPTRSAVELWHNQGVQNGTVGFYQWLRDYGPRDAEGNQVVTPLSFNGPAFANPDPSALGQERWQAVLDISRTLARTRVFDPPTSETGILVSFDAVNIDGWDRVFSSYIELVKAGVWNSFISDREILDGSEDLSRWKMIYLPVLDFTDRRIVTALREYVENGGVLVALQPEALSYDMQGRDISALREDLFGVAGGRIRAAGPRAVHLEAAYGADRILARGESYDITPTRGTQVIGTYADGSPAVLSRRLRRGRTIYWAAPLADVYVTDPYADPDLDGRGAFFKAMERTNGIEDYSWIWDLTYENLHEVTGTGEPDLPPIRTAIPLN